MAVGFLSSIRTERLTSKSYVGVVLAQQVAEAALLVAQERLNKAVLNHDDYIVAYNYPADQDYGPLLQIIPGGNVTPTILASTSAGDPQVERTTSASVDLNTQAGIIEKYNASLSKYYRVPWEELKHPTSNLVLGRYAYILVDEQARLNPRFHFGDSRTTLPGNWTSSVAEIPLRTENPLLMTEGEIAELKKFPSLLLTPFSLGQVFASQERAKASKHLFSTHTATNEEIIPQGYPDAGKSKYNVNELATNTNYGATATERAENIATIIERNLPTFKDRDVSLSSVTNSADKLRYLNRLAASIVDYIDTDTDSTLVNNGEPAGRDLFPLVTAIAENYQRTSFSSLSTTFRRQLFVQLWNPYTELITGDVQLNLRNLQYLFFPPALEEPFDDYKPGNVNVMVRPNEMVVVEFPEITQTFSRPAFSPTNPNVAQTGGAIQATVDETTPYFELLWNGKLVDMSRRKPVGPDPAEGGLTRNSKFYNDGLNNWRCSFIPTQFNTTIPWRFVGDPRATYLSNYEWSEVTSSYPTISRWKGRQVESSPRYQNFELRWRNRDYVRANPVEGLAPGNVTKKPSEVTSPYDAFANLEKINAPFYLRNNKMISIGELGNIFDPAQVDDVGKAPTGATSNSPYISGGGRTLRIGQPEFSYWDTEGKRASQLLDLFTVAPLSKEVIVYPQIKGLINVNTAPLEIFEALVYGLAPRSDESYTTGKITYTNATTLSNKIIDIRGSKYFKNLNEFITKKPDPITTPDASQTTIQQEFVNEKNYTPELPYDDDISNRIKLMDRAREEPFARMINALTTQSRAFRIYIVAQGLSSQGKPNGTFRVEATVELQRKFDTKVTPPASKLETIITFRQ
jgi:hypothetical protein